jgi:hypothetical protein
MKKLHAFDLIILGYLAITAAMAAAARARGLWIYVGLHAGAAGLVLLLAWMHGRRGGRFWTFCRYWYIVPLVMAAFRELHFLVPEVSPFEDRRFDRALMAIDARWFGDTDAFFLSMLHPIWADLLHLCYWFYFLSMLIVGGVLYAKAEWVRLREYVAVVMLALFTSYLGYFAVPAVGPHHFFPSRPPELDGWVLGGPMHRAISAAELVTADAFPSGHALMSMIVILLSWRHHHPTFRWVALPALGCIWATVALRYHYVVDVVASAAILPAVLWLGAALHRWREGPPTSSPLP